MSNAFSLTKLARLFNVGNAGQSLVIDPSGNPALSGVYPNSIGRNVVVNGGCEVSQVNGTTQTTPTTNQYPIDNWVVGSTLTASGVIKVTQQTVKAGNLTALRSLGATSAVQFQVTTAQTSVPSTDQYSIRIPIEDVNFARFQYGTANAKAGSLQFKVNVSQSGTYSGTIMWGTSPYYSYGFTFTLVGGLDTLVTIPNIPGLTTASALAVTSAWVCLNLGSGTSALGSASDWTQSNKVGVSGQTNLFTTLNATLTITDVQFEVGSFCTPYERKLYDQVLRECQRYLPVFTGLSTTNVIGIGFQNSSGQFVSVINTPVTTRVPIAGISGSVVGAASQLTVGGTSVVSGIGVCTISLASTTSFSLYFTLATIPGGQSGQVFINTVGGTLIGTGAQI
jgi:hypothetical protein